MSSLFTNTYSNYDVSIYKKKCFVIFFLPEMLIQSEFNS